MSAGIPWLGKIGDFILPVSCLFQYILRGLINAVYLILVRKNLCMKSGFLLHCVKLIPFIKRCPLFYDQGICRNMFRFQADHPSWGFSQKFVQRLVRQSIQRCVFLLSSGVQAENMEYVFCGMEPTKQRNRCQKHNHYSNLNIDKDINSKVPDNRPRPVNSCVNPIADHPQTCPHRNVYGCGPVPMGMTVAYKTTADVNCLKPSPSDIQQTILYVIQIYAAYS